MQRFLKTVTAVAVGLAVTSVAAQEYPSRTISIIVPFAAGGPTDKVARDFAEALRKQMPGSTVVVENTAGAGSTIGTSRVAKAKPDGYQLLITHVGMATTPVLYRKLNYDYQNDFEYLGMINDVPMVVIGRPDHPAGDFKALREWIEKNKGKINLGNAGVGSASHLCGLLVKSAMKAEMTDVPYKGTAPAIADLMGGQIDLLCDQTTNTTAQIEGKRVKPYAVTTMTPLETPAYKGLPTLDSSGLKGFQVTIWHGLYAPKGTPPAVLTKLNGALKAVLKDPDFVKSQEALGANIVRDGRVNPAEHKKFVQSEVERFGPVFKAAGAFAD